ncbi:MULTISPECIES: class A sortase [unclassified Exiguobacterium]|uniref:class A sortase n=1 Tax=unclassified Exiguobacterium TaxID=2644629 RepID=UPI001BE96ADE|nr:MULTISPECIES: class A sortase [unclassified Exiguobacterium]
MKRSRYFVGGLLLLIGTLLLSESWWKDQLATWNSQQVTAEIQPKQPETGEFEFSNVEPLSWEQLLTVRNRFHELPTLGLISIPDVNLELPILYGLDNENLAVGAGTMDPSQHMGTGNYALAGHYTQSPTALFGPLHTLDIGMSIYLTDMKHTFQYEVTSLETVPPTQVDVLEPTTEPTITLVTCTFDATERLIVKGRFVNQTPL